MWLAFSALAQDPTIGLFLQTPESFEGYTIFAPSSSRTTYLIDNCGKEVHQWTSAYLPGLSAYLLPDGDLLRAARIPSTFNGGGSGGRIERITWDGDVEWAHNFSSSQYHQHHDFELLPNGNILVIAWEVVPDEEVLDAGRQSVGAIGFWSSYIAELEPLGFNAVNIVWEWRAFDHLIQDVDSTKNNYGVISDHPERIDANLDLTGSADWLHMNAIDYNEELDQIVVSAHDIHEIFVIDHSTTTAEAKTGQGGTYGKGGDLLYRWGNPVNYDRGSASDKVLFGQHDISWIESGLPGEGAFMVFNNGVNRPGGLSYSTVEVWTPPMDSAGFYALEQDVAYGPDQLDWIVGDDDLSFYSSRISGAQRQPNGNTLICVGRLGQFIEVDSLGNVVWEYRNPVNSSPQIQGTLPFGTDVFRAYRYGPDYPAFDDKELISGLPIELQPYDYECELNSAIVELNGKEYNFTIYPNPVSNTLFVNFDTMEKLNYSIINSTGQIMADGTIERNLSVNVSNYIRGIYEFIVYDNRSNERISNRFLVL